MTQNKRFFLLVGTMSVIAAFVVHFSLQREALSAPQVFISAPATTTQASDFSFTIGTTTPLSLYGSTTLAVYGSTTIQTPVNTAHAFRIINSASSTVFEIDTVNSSTTFLGNLNTLSTTATSTMRYGLNVAISGGCLAINGTCVSAVADAPSDATYIVTSLNGTLSAERRLQGTANQITLTDGGANGDLTLSVPNDFRVSGLTAGSSTVGFINATSSTASVFTGSITASGGITLTCTGCLTDANVVDTITLTNITQITNRAISDTTGTLAVGRGGTGLTTFAAGNVVYASALDTLAGLTAGASSTILSINTSGLPIWTAQPALTTLRVTGSGTSTSITGNLFITANLEVNGSINFTSGTLNAPLSFGGRSLTVSGSALDADAELYTSMITFFISSSTLSTSTNTVAMHKFATAITISRVSCSTDRGTSTIQFDRRSEGTENTAGTNVLSANLSCGSGADTNATTAFSSATVAADALLNLTIQDAEVNGVKPTMLHVWVKFTRDD